MNQVTKKTAKVVKEYRFTFMREKMIIPAGATVSNMTAIGPDDNYRFWNDFSKYVEQGSFLWDFANVYGINIPQEYCEPYPKN